MTMCDKELLVGYLYDEVDAAERRTMETHLLACTECRGELKDLRSTRTRLAAWAPPTPELEFQMVRAPEAAASRTRRWSISPAWGLAAAAVLVLSVASAIANVEVKFGADGLTVRTGALRASPVQPAPVASTVSTQAIAAADDPRLRAELQTIALRIRDLEAAAGNGTRPVLTSAHVPATQAPPADVLRAVRQLISESESRQEQELARRLSQVLRDVEGLRRVDLDRVQRALAEMQGVTDTTIIRQQQIENHLLRVGQPK
jgi:predicted anti-sigma-YlaC factor YlaD